MTLNQNYIYAMFSRSYDTSTDESGVHLIASAYSQATELDLTNIKIILNNEKKKSILTKSDQFIIVRITFNLNLDLNSNFNSNTFDNKSIIKTINHSDYLIEFILPISNWLINLRDVKPDNYTGLLEGIIGSLFNKSEKFDSHLNNTLFIFENISWSNIVEIHKIYGINISGVTKPNRAFLGTSQYNLSKILGILGVSNKSIFDSLKRMRLLDHHSSLYVKSTDESSKQNLFKLNKEFQFNLKVLILEKILNFKIQEILLKIANCKKIITSINDSICSYKSKLQVLDLKSTKNSNSNIKNKNRLNSTISDRKSSLALQKKILDSLEVQHSNLTDLIKSIPELTPDLIGELYAKYIVSSKEKLIDPHLSLIKLDKKTNKLNHNFNSKLFSKNVQKDYVAQLNYLPNSVNKTILSIEGTGHYKEYHTSAFLFNSNSISTKVLKAPLPITSNKNLHYTARTNSKSIPAQLGEDESKISRPFTFDTSVELEVYDIEVTNKKETQARSNNEDNLSINISVLESEKNPTLLSFFLKDCQKIMDLAVDSDEEDKRVAQLKLEESWISLIENRLNNEKNFVDRYQGNLISTLSSIKETLNVMNENNYFKKNFPKLNIFTDLSKIDYIVIAYTISITLYTRFSYNYLAINIGKNILSYIYYKEKDKKIQTGKGCHSIVNLSFEEFKKLVDITDLEKTFYFGNFYLEIIQRFPHDIFKRKVNLDSYYTNEPYFLELNKDYIDIIKQNIIINPNTLPMICQPNPWTDSKFGGYLTNKYQQKDIITRSEIFNHKVENKTPIYETVNYLNNLEFGVNNLMLDYILSSEGSYLLESVKADNELQRALTLEVAKLYSKSKFYLNTHADWRGRIYTQSFFLSYQGGDLSTSLLNFWKGEPLNDIGKFYLYIYGCNSHNERGIGKTSFKNRIEWVKKNYLKIINLDKELILKADSPFIFTAFCLNMREIHNNPNYIIKTPVFLDATCSGIQHLAGLMKDLELGINTNLLPQTEDDIPEDIYNYLLRIINKIINKFGKDNIEFEKLSKVKLERKQIKAPIMTKVYNVTKYGMSKQLQDVLKEDYKEDLTPIENIKNKLEEIMNSNKNKKKPIFICKGNDGKKVELSKRDIFKMAEIINEQIFVVFPALNNIYNYFIDIAKLTSELDIPLYWVTPNGLKITQRYLRKKKKVISVNLFSITKKVVIHEKKDKIDKVKQAQAIIPNIIHSLDADHLISIIQKSADSKFSPLITVHDCFGTLPNLMKDLEYKVKKEFVLLYSQNQFLKEFHQSFIQLLNDFQFDIKKEKNEEYVLLGTNWLKIPSIPKQGNLDLDNIMKSKYMIS
jgi:hypothetical protein